MPTRLRVCLLPLCCITSLHLLLPFCLQLPPDAVTMIQPPADHRLGKAHLVGACWGCCCCCYLFGLPLFAQGVDAGQCHATSPTSPIRLACPLSRLPPQMHYTWGPQFKKGDTLVWEFDKRKYTEPKHEQEVGGGWRVNRFGLRWAVAGVGCGANPRQSACARTRLPGATGSLRCSAGCPNLPAPAPFCAVLPLQLPKLPLPPPFEEGWKLQDGIAVTRELYDTLVLVRV